MVRRIAFSIVSKLALQPWFRLTRGQTLGVRAVVRDGDGAFLLVRHTYVPGWTFPGGGVDRLETRGGGRGAARSPAPVRRLCEP
jgi:hypothetical protein